MNPSTWQITPEVKTLPALKNPLLIEGLPGIGNVGKIATDFLIEELKAQKLYSFFSYKFPHSVFVNEKNLVEMPKLELYYKKFTPQENKPDLLLLTGDIQPIDEESCYTFCEEVLNLAAKFSCTHLITLGGIGLHQVPDKPKVYCTSNDAMLLKEYLSCPLIERKIFGVVGPVIGVSGVLVGLAKKRKVKGVALLAETFGHPMYLGIKGAKEILRVLENRFGYAIDLKKMSKEIVEMEKEVMKKTKEWTWEAFGGAHGKGKSSEMNYIG